jgi:hypothetical protein
MNVSVSGVTNRVLSSLLFSAVGVGCDVVAASVDGADVTSVVASVRGAAASVVVVVVVLGIDAGVV